MSWILHDIIDTLTSHAYGSSGLDGNLLYSVVLRTVATFQEFEFMSHEYHI